MHSSACGRHPGGTAHPQYDVTNVTDVTSSERVQLRFGGMAGAAQPAPLGLERGVTGVTDVTPRAMERCDGRVTSDSARLEPGVRSTLAFPSSGIAM
jgi:hypothetical protein